MKIPKRYIPDSLTKKQKQKQIKSIHEHTHRPVLKNVKTRRSKWTVKATNYFGDRRSLKDIASKLKINVKGLKEIYKKGEKAYFTSGSRPNQTPYSWAQARVYAVLFGSPARQIDKDIVDAYDIPLLTI